MSRDRTSIPRSTLTPFATSILHSLLTPTPPSTSFLFTFFTNTTTRHKASLTRFEAYLSELYSEEAQLRRESDPDYLWEEAYERTPSRAKQEWRLEIEKCPLGELNLVLVGMGYEERLDELEKRGYKRWRKEDSNFRGYLPRSMHTSEMMAREPLGFRVVRQFEEGREKKLKEEKGEKWVEKESLFFGTGRGVGWLSFLEDGVKLRKEEKERLVEISDLR